MNNKQELVKLIQEYPELPIIFYASTDDINDRYTTTVLRQFTSYKTHLYIYDYYDEPAYTDDLAEVVEYYMDMFADEDRYKKLNDTEYEIEIKNYVENNITHFDAIIVSLTA